MKRILKNKRGMAMESAIMFMLLIFTLGMLMTGTSMIMHLRVRLNDKTIQREITIEQIGEKFVYGMDYSEDLTKGGYTQELTNENDTLTLKKGEKVVLYIEKKQNEDGTVAVIKWQYSKPEE